ncbi:MAG: HipA N-terminal domain-containing protein [Mangrovibacterium sp.]
MRRAGVYVNALQAGELRECADGSYEFEYAEDYFEDDACDAISLTLPKSQRLYRSEKLFPFFFNMLSEGKNRATLLKSYALNKRDFFGLLLSTAGFDTVGAVEIKPLGVSL